MDGFSVAFLSGWMAQWSSASQKEFLRPHTTQQPASPERERDRLAGNFSSSPQVNPSDRRSLPFHPVSRILICGMPRLLHLYHSPDVQCWDFSGVVGRPRQGGWKRQCRDKEATKKKQKTKSKSWDFNSFYFLNNPLAKRFVCQGRRTTT